MGLFSTRARAADPLPRFFRRILLILLLPAVILPASSLLLPASTFTVTLMKGDDAALLECPGSANAIRKGGHECSAWFYHRSDGSWTGRRKATLVVADGTFTVTSGKKVYRFAGGTRS